MKNKRAKFSLIFLLFFSLFFLTSNGFSIFAEQIPKAHKIVLTKGKNQKKQRKAKEQVGEEKSIFTPNSVVHKGKKITFHQSAYNYYEQKDASWETLNRRCANISREIRKKNVCVGPEFNGEDNLPNYILGHNPGTMTNIASLSVGDSIFVTDKNGKTFEYIVVDYVNAEKSYDFVNGSGDVSNYFYYGANKEAVLIQYCINHQSHTFLSVPKEREESQRTK